MTSQRTRKLALSIQDELGIKYTEALRKAKIQIEERLALAVTAPSASRATELTERRFPHEGTFGSGLPLGLDETYGNFVTWNFKDNDHLLCVAPTGNGKTVFLQNLAYSALRSVPSAELSIVSLKSPDAFRFADPHARGVARSIEDAVALLRALKDMALGRQELVSNHGVSSFHELPRSVQQTYGLELRRHILIIDELSSLTEVLPVPETPEPFAPSSDDQKIMGENAWRSEMNEILSFLVRVGHSVAISVAGATQRIHSTMALELADYVQKSARLIMGRVPSNEAHLLSLNQTDRRPFLAPMNVGHGAFIPSSGESEQVMMWHPLDDEQIEWLESSLQPLSDRQRLDLDGHSDWWIDRMSYDV